MIFLFIDNSFELSFILADASKGSENISVNSNEYTLFYPCISPYDCTSYNSVLPAGKYLFELWGSQGGNSVFTGGKGGYSKGVITFSSSTQIYIFLGGQPSPNSGTTTIFGGYNGGGGSISDSNGNGGGGATDIRINGNSLYHRVIVAGAGGGGSARDTFLAGAGGGVEGKPSLYGPSTIGGKQNEGGIGGHGSQGVFGDGGTHGGGSSGGGGGWYGGCGSGNTGSNTGGGGGSGYVFTSGSFVPSGFALDTQYYMTNISLIDGDNEIPSPTGATTIGHSNSGAVRITILSASMTIPPTLTPTFSMIYINTCMSTSSSDYSIMFLLFVVLFSLSDYSSSSRNGLLFSIYCFTD